jgi:hypothetical protein
MCQTIIHSLSRVVVPATLDSISVNAHFTRFLETVKKIVLKIVLIIVNINKDENKSLISNQFSLKKVNKRQMPSVSVVKSIQFYLGKEISSPNI